MDARRSNERGKQLDVELSECHRMATQVSEAYKHTQREIVAELETERSQRLDFVASRRQKI